MIRGTVKAECDYCCTSSNAVDVVNSIPEDKEILFLPDKFLGTYIEMVTGRELTIWDGGLSRARKNRGAESFG